MLVVMVFKIFFLTSCEASVWPSEIIINLKYLSWVCLHNYEHWVLFVALINVWERICIFTAMDTHLLLEPFVAILSSMLWFMFHSKFNHLQIFCPCATKIASLELVERGKQEVIERKEKNILNSFQEVYRQYKFVFHIFH